MLENMSDEELREEVAGRNCVDFREEEKEEKTKEFYQHLIHYSRSCAFRMFFAGSRCEIPGQENIMSNNRLSLDLLDTDRMFCATYIYVITRRETVPDQFNGRVVRIYFRGLHAGYVKLFNEDKTEFKRSDLSHDSKGDMLRGPAETLNITNRREHDEELKHFISQESWLSKVTEPNTAVMEDRVFAVHSQYWPLEMNEWITRPRLSGFPSKSIIKQVVRYGCDFVPVSHKLSTDPSEWRFSFSKAECIIINFFKTSQRCAYRTLHLLNKMVKSRMHDSKLCTYYFKTLMLWAAEEKPAEFWSEHDLVNTTCELLCELRNWLQRKFCPNYFIRTNNMIDHLTDTELSHDIDALYQLLQQQHQIKVVLHTSRLVEAIESNEKCYIEAPVWLYASLLIMEQLHYSEDIFTRLFTKSSPALINRAVSIELFDIYYGLYYHKTAENSLIQSHNNYLMKSIKHFHAYRASHNTEATVEVCCSTTVSLHFIPSLFVEYKPDTIESPLLTTLNTFNSADPEKCLLYSQSMDNIDETLTSDVHLNENTYGNTKTTVTVYRTTTVEKKTYKDIELFYKEFPGLSPTVNISWFINNAYLANLYYITQRDYRATEEMCENIIRVGKQSFHNHLFAEQFLPVMLSTKWTSVYDVELQAMLGIYSLCEFMFNKSDRSRSVCLGVCALDFALYLKCRCCEACDDHDMDIRRWNKCGNEINKHFEECKGDPKVQNGRRIVRACLIVIQRTFKRLLSHE